MSFYQGCNAILALIEILFYCMNEVWKDIEGYEGLYQISNIGRVKSLNYNREGIEKILKIDNYSKYGSVKLHLNGKGVSRRLSRIVAVHFIDNPYNLPYVLHKKEDLDENGLLYNGADNLFWGTAKDNSEDRDKKGRANNHFKNKHPNKGKFGALHYCSKKVNQYTKNGIFIKEWGGTGDVERELGLCRSSISACCRGKLKSAGGFIWRFK